MTGAASCNCSSGQMDWLCGVLAGWMTLQLINWWCLLLLINRVHYKHGRPAAKNGVGDAHHFHAEVSPLTRASGWMEAYSLYFVRVLLPVANRNNVLHCVVGMSCGWCVLSCGRMISAMELSDILPDRFSYDKMSPPRLEGLPTKVFNHFTVMGLDSINENSMVNPRLLPSLILILPSLLFTLLFFFS